MARPYYHHEDLMDDLAYGIHQYLLDVSTTFEGIRFVMVPITDIVKKFERNHRTVQRRIAALKEEGILTPVITKNLITLYCVKELDDQP